MQTHDIYTVDKGLVPTLPNLCQAIYAAFACARTEIASSLVGRPPHAFLTPSRVMYALHLPDLSWVTPLVLDLGMPRAIMFSCLVHRRRLARVLLPLLWSM